MIASISLAFSLAASQLLGIGFLDKLGFNDDFKVETKNLTLLDCDPSFNKARNLIGITDDPVLKAQITYKTFNKKKYDEFMHNSARLHGNMVAAHSFVVLANVYVKDTARSTGGSSEIADTIKTAVGDKPDTDWTIDDSVAVLKARKAKGQLSKEQLAGLANFSTSIVGLSAFILKLPSDALDLTKRGTDLSKHVKDDFKPLQLTDVIPALTDAIGSIKDAGDQATETANTMSKIGAALSSAI
jgi:hypothetical protein